MQNDVITKIENMTRFNKEPGKILTGKLLAARAEDGMAPWGVPFIHVAGTNGKGSTTAYLSTILQKCGYRVGMFTSPHLIDFTERLQVNGVQITRERACELAEAALESGLRRGIEGGMFDYCVVMAVEYFAEQGCDIAVMETGIGGKLDSTNCLGVPVVSVITPVGMDHMSILGNTVEEIAAEKAGIIKNGAPAVLAAQVPAADQVLTAACAEQEVAVYRGPDYREKAAGLTLGLTGSYQVDNAATALAAVAALREQGWNLPEDKVIEALAETRWPGRLEKISSHPDVYLDGAHNMHGVKALRASLAQLYPDRKLNFLMGVLADKDYMEMLEEMLPLAARIDTVTPDSGRALQGAELSRLIQARGIPSKFYENTQEALAAMKQAGPDDVICIFGSLYFIGELEAMLQE